MTEDIELSQLQQWLSTTGNAALNFLIKLAFAIIVFIIIKKILDRFLRFLDAAMVRHEIESTVRHFVTALVKYTVLILTVTTIIVQLGIVAASSLAALLAAGGVGISLALQGAISNLAGGILLLVLKPFKEGDYIVVKGSDIEGTVEKIEIYYTTIRTLFDNIVVVPNSSLTNNSIQNTAEHGTKWLLIKVSVSYKQDLAAAKRVLEEIKEQEPRMLPDIGRVHVDELGESSVVLCIRSVVKATEYYATYWDTIEKIRLRFAKEGIEIPYNQLDVHMIPSDAKEQ